MNIDQLTYFIKTVEHLNITKAAEELYVSESTISKSLKRLENELGFPLFYRINNKIVLSNEGEASLKHVKRIIKEWNLITQLRDESRSKTIYLCSDDIFLLQNTVAILGVGISNAELSSREIVDQLLDSVQIKNSFLQKKCDISVTLSDPEIKKDVFTFTYTEKFVLVIKKEDGNPIDHNIVLEKFHFNNYLVLGSNDYIKEKIDNYIKRHKITGDIEYQKYTSIFLSKLLYSERTAIMPKVSSKGLDTTLFEIIDLKDDELSFPVYITVDANNKQLYDYIVETLS